MTTRRQGRAGLRRVPSLFLALILLLTPVRSVHAADFAFWDLLTDPAGNGSQLPERLARMPNMMGAFFARGGQATLPVGFAPSTTQTVNLPARIQQYTFTAVDSVIIFAPVGPTNQGGFQQVEYTGPGGFSFTPPGVGNPSDAVLTANDISGLFITQIGQVVPLAENQGFTNAVVALFPGAQFVRGSATVVQSEPPFPHGLGEADSFLNSFVYQTVTPGGTAVIPGNPGGPILGTILLPNPTGGGLAGRIDYFENGSAVLRDRVYFLYNGAFNFHALGRSFTINRYTLGGEIVFLDQTFSMEVRLPMAGIPSVSQAVGSPVGELDRFVFGNLGLLPKLALYWSETLAVTAGLGFSLPTAPGTSVTSAGGAPLLQIRNETVLIQPVLALAWAPTERCYLQLATQFDLDPAGNPVYAALNNGLQQIGRFTDRNYWYAHGAAGYWLYLDADPQAWLNCVALQSELTYIQSMGGHGTFQANQIGIAPLAEGANTLNVSLGLNLLLSNQASVTAGVTAPILGQRPYDWNALVQLNWYFGAP